MGSAIEPYKFEKCDQPKKKGEVEEYDVGKVIVPGEKITNSHQLDDDIVFQVIPVGVLSGE